MPGWVRGEGHVVSVGRTGEAGLAGLRLYSLNSFADSEAVPSCLVPGLGCSGSECAIPIEEEMDVTLDWLFCIERRACR